METGQVLDYGFKSKICWECNSKKAKADDVEFQEWYESYKNNCSKNDHVFLELLKPVFRRLSERSLLLRCLSGCSQNQNESLNGVVWSKAPKHKFKGPKSIEMAGMSAVLQFDCGQRGRQEVMRLAGIPHGNHTEEGGERKDRKRMYGSARKASEVEKKKRVTQRQAKLVREQEAVAREGGPSYASGAFNLDPIVHSQQAKD